MLDKLKLFNKDKDRSKSSKRTSSSSGFSSARSDSSLSLNNDPNTTSIANASSTSKSGKKNETVNKPTSSSSNKTPKVTSNSSSSRSVTPALPAAIKMQSKSDKKKSVENNLEQQQQQQQAASKLQQQQKVSNVKFQPQQIIQMQQQMLSQQQNNDPRMRQQQQAVFRKIEIRTDSKAMTGLPQPQTKIIIQPLTSIPKPMAAIKGTTKAQIKMSDECYDDVIKTTDKSMASNISLNGGEQKTQVVNPLSMSPLHNHHNQLRSRNGSMSDSIHSNNHSNSSDSSVIYRPSASESGTEFYHSNISPSSSSSMQQQQQHRNPIPNRKVDHFNDALQTNGHKFNTIPTKLNGAGSNANENNNHIATTMFEEQQQKAAAAVQASQQGPTGVPLRSIMRTFNNNQQQQHHVTTLPTRGMRGGQNLVNGFYDEHLNQGYCSDGDALRKSQLRYTDIENGYLSEGGVGGGGVTNPHFMSIFRNRGQLMPMTIAEER
jgi:CRISPR/Cas system CMR subunit Cmr6 (Cas7 group RAMP superfamily)